MKFSTQASHKPFMIWKGRQMRKKCEEGVKGTFAIL